MNITNTPEDDRQAKGGKTWKESDKKNGGREQALGKFRGMALPSSLFQEGGCCWGRFSCTETGTEGLAFLFSCPVLQC